MTSRIASKSTKTCFVTVDWWSPDSTVHRQYKRSYETHDIQWVNVEGVWLERCSRCGQLATN